MKNMMGVIDVMNVLLQKSFLSFLQSVIEKKVFSITDFIVYMEPVFKKAGYREFVENHNKKSLFNILVLRLDAIGDTILTSGFLRELRTRYPRAYITLLVQPTVYNLVELCPYVNEVITFDWQKAGQHGFVGLYQYALSLCKKHLWNKQFDLCICPRWDFDIYFSIMLGYMSGARTRIGYSEYVCAHKHRLNTGYDSLLTHAIVNPPDVIHEADRNFYIIESVTKN